MKRQKKEHGSISSKKESIMETQLGRVLRIWYVIEAVLVLIVAVIASFVAYDALKTSSRVIISVIVIAYFVWLIIRTAQYRHDRLFSEIAEDIRVIRRTEELNANSRKSENGDENQFNLIREEIIGNSVHDALKILKTEDKINANHNFINDDELPSDQTELLHSIDETEQNSAVQISTDNTSYNRKPLYSDFTSDQIDSDITKIKRRRHRDEIGISESKNASSLYITNDKADISERKAESENEIGKKLRRRRRNEQNQSKLGKENEAVNELVHVKRRKRYY